jgi:hypothetical protein
MEKAFEKEGNWQRILDNMDVLFANQQRMMAHLDLFWSDLVAAQFLGRATTSAHGEARYDGNGDIYDEQPVFDEGPMFVEELLIDLESSGFESCAPFNCSLYCLSHVVDVMASKVATLDEVPPVAVIWDGDSLYGHGLQGVSLEKLVEMPFQDEQSRVNLVGSIGAADEVFDELSEDVICNENMLHDFNSHNDLRQQLANDQVFHARSGNEIQDEETGHDDLLDQLASNGTDVSASEQHCLAVSDDSSQECTRAQAEIIEEQKPPKADENHVLDDRQLQPPVLEASPACSTFEMHNVMQHEASAASSQGSLTSFEGELTLYGDSVQDVGEHQLVVSEESLEECKRDEVKRNIQDAVKSNGGYVLDCREFQLAASEVSSSENNMVEVQGAAQEEPLPLNGVEENSDKGDFVCKEQA